MMTLKRMMSVCVALAMGAGAALAATDSVKVKLQEGGRELTYKGALIVDGETVTLKNKDLSATEGNVVAALVVNGGKLVLDHCTITKTGDGVRSASRRGGGQPPMGGQGMAQGDKPMGPPPGGNGQGGPGGMPQGGGQGGPGGGQGGPGKGMPGQGGPGMGKPGEGGGPGGDDSFNFYGLNSAVVAVGKGSTIEMIGCTVNTEAEYANAVFSCDNAEVNISEGITINTTKGSSRGLYATAAGKVTATGVVTINTQGAHCAALATDRGGGTVTVGTPGTSDCSVLNTNGDGSPCIYSTGDITVYNAQGNAAISQTMVIEGKNTINITDCDFTGNSREHGGVMLYQSTSGDAEEGTCVLTMQHSTLRNMSASSPMLLITNTHSVVNMQDCTLLTADGTAPGTDYALVTCQNCNTDHRQWGRAGTNGGQVEINLKSQKLQGTLLANETESAITIAADDASDVTGLKNADGKGTVAM